MTDKLLPLNREELDEIDARKHILYDEMQNLIKQSRTALELQAEVERLKEVLMDIRDHSMPPFNHYKWVYYINEVSTNTLSYYKEERFWCAACGSWGDHRSGTCPDIKKEESK